MAKRRARGTANWIRLPPPRRRGTRSLEEALTRRRSVYEFADRPLTDAELAQLLWAVQGVTSSEGDRTAPSAGALFPLEIYVVTAQGLHHYEPPGHQLRRLSSRDLREALFDAGLSQEPLLEAPATFLIAAVYRRTEREYGKRWSPRYIHLEVGHAAQNLLLQAVCLDLSAVPIAAFEEEEVQEALSLPADHRPLYLIPVGPLRNDR
ncbi:MAG: SagB/ThcOx family dehydrogenase [Thermoanaerobaculia bacterium]